MKNRLLLAAALAAAVVVGLLALRWNPQGHSLDAKFGLATAPTGGDFTLQSAAGPVALADFRGKVVLIYFGYTFCPDICPTSLATTAQALSALNEDELSQVRTLFVSVDPERDTVEKLKNYGAFFHPSIIGVTGTAEEVAAAAKLYGVAYWKQDVKSEGGYVVDHSAYTYLVDPNGKLVRQIPHGTSAPEVLRQIRVELAHLLPSPPKPPNPAKP
jgi:protein SCO1